MSLGIPVFSEGSWVEDALRQAPESKGSTSAGYAALPKTAWAAVTATCLTETSVAPTRTGREQLALSLFGAVDIPRLLASIGYMNWAITEVLGEGCNPVNKPTVRSMYVSPGSQAACQIPDIFVGGVPAFLMWSFFWSE